MYLPGKILRAGGGEIGIGRERQRDHDRYHRRHAQDRGNRQAAPAAAMGHGNAAGGRQGGGDRRLQAAQVNFDGANYNPFIWNPATGKWAKGAATQSGKARLYHSSAILLPDATVLVGGGGAPGPQTNTNVEIYYPPYLFNGLDKFADRPKILAAPTGLKVGRNFSIDVNNGASIGRVTLVKTGSVTHSFNMDQRFLDLTFTTAGNTLLVNAPNSNKLATPGHYLLFVLNKSGVPSVAKVLPMFVTAN